MKTDAQRKRMTDVEAALLAALVKLVAAEDRFVAESGVNYTDPVAEAVALARPVIEMAKARQ